MKQRFIRRYHFRRYQTRRFQNPYFREREKRESSWRSRLQLLVGLLLFIGLVYSVAYAPFWMIRDVRIEGLQYMSSTPLKEQTEAHLRSHRWLIFQQRHPWFLNSMQLKKDLTAQFAFASIETDIKSHVLVLTVKERVSQVIWFVKKQPFFVDLEGTVIRALSQDEASALTISGPAVEGPFPLQDRLRGLPRIVDDEDEAAVPGKTVLVAGGIGKIIEMNQLLISNNLTPDHFSVERGTSAWARAELRNGFAVLFDVTSPIADQVKNLLAVLSQDVKNRSSLDYIDVRFGNHVYVQGGN